MLILVRLKLNQQNLSTFMRKSLILYSVYKCQTEIRSRVNILLKLMESLLIINLISCIKYVLFKLVMACSSPPVIANAVMTTSGLTNGSVTVYSCESGFISTSGDAFISCNGTHWSVTSFACSGKMNKLFQFTRTWTKEEKIVSITLKELQSCS